MEKLKDEGKSKKQLQSGSISNYMWALRSLFNKCKAHYNKDDIDLIRISYDPFANVKIPKYKRKRKNTGAEQLIKIRGGAYTTERENIGRDVFMMLFYLMDSNSNSLLIRSKTDLVVFARNLFSLFEKAEREKNLLFRFMSNQEKVYLELDVIKWESILNNMLSNAVK